MVWTRYSSGKTGTTEAARDGGADGYPAAAVPEGHPQAGSTQAGSTQAGSTQAGSTQAGSTQAGDASNDTTSAASPPAGGDSIEAGANATRKDDHAANVGANGTGT